MAAPPTTPDPAHAEAFIRLWMTLLGLSITAVLLITGVALLLVLRRHRLSAPRQRRQVTSRLSAWEEAGSRAEPWAGPDPADFDEEPRPDA